ncbi:MAG: hypothetical protein ACD_9C00274G0001 [uncultured bacterium]|nr:MAG: hypothetical protein ACD_9C00274G0001 [uncultured bacterium]
MNKCGIIQTHLFKIKIKKMNKKYLSTRQACLPMRQGSVLAYSLIVIAAMLAIASSISVVAVIEKKGASGTEFSMQSLQTADSGVQLALKKINKELYEAIPGTIDTIFSCDGNDNVPNNTDGGPAGSSYELSFYDSNGVKLSCDSDNVSEIASIKSVGTYNNTVRAVNVAVAANVGFSSFKTYEHNADPFASEIGGCAPNCRIADLCNREVTGSTCISVMVRGNANFVGMEDCSAADGTGYFSAYTGFDYICAK